jgi:hypothetical protein
MPLILELDVPRKLLDEPGCVIRRTARTFLDHPETPGCLELEVTDPQDKEGKRCYGIPTDPAIILYPIQFDEPVDVDDEL